MLTGNDCDWISLSETPLSFTDMIEWAKDAAAGAIASFIGTTREDKLEGRSLMSIIF